MLVVCNGIYKSGSTWIFLMLLELVGQDEIPEFWRDPNQARNIDVLNAPEQVFNAATKCDLVSKIHSYEADYLSWLRGRGARIVVTRRDHEDILASHYHHFSSEKLRLPIWLYAMTVGLLKAIEVELYDNVSTRPNTSDLLIDFSDLKNDPEGTFRRVVRELELNYSDVEIAEAARRGNMRGRDYSARFAGMEQREWFFRRAESTHSGQKKVMLRITTRVAKRLVFLRPVAAVLTRLFMLDPRRAKFARNSTVSSNVSE